MGVKNRERRRAKQKQRQQRTRARGGYGPEADAGWVPPRGPEEQVAELLTGAAHLTGCDDHAGHELPEQLDALAGWPQPALVDRTVLSTLQRAVTHAWEYGWQPADLVRAAGREAGARVARLAVDAVAAETRGYATATVDHRWAAQLNELDARAWWERDDGYLDAWGAREGLARPAVLGCAVTLLAMLTRLPVLPRLCPLPGAARPAAAPPAASEVDQRILDRVRALLAKAESTGFPEEAEAYSAKAQELMARYSIDQVLLAAGADRPATDAQPAGRRLGVDNPYEQPKALLLDCVAQANRCRSVWHKQLGFATVMGFPADLDAVELLYTSLLVQATAAMLHEGSRRDRAGRSRTRAFRSSFLTAYAARIGERLRTATETATRGAAAETGRGDLLPVLAAREREVDEAVAELFPELVSHHLRVTDREGWASGTAAADRASLQLRERLTGG
jgi:hypothetical protein